MKISTKQITVIEAIIIVLMILFVWIVNVATSDAGMITSLGVTSDYALGNSNEEQIIKLDVGYSWNNEISEHFSYDKELYIPFLYSEGNIRPGLGFRLRLNYNFNDNWSIYSGAGLATGYEFGDINGLADSWLYGSLETGIKYKWFSIGVDHLSSPLDRGDGVNLIIGKINIEF